jgi:chromosome segregation ATPase
MCSSFIGNVLHQIRSCPALPFAPLSPPPSPSCGQKTSVRADRLIKGGFPIPSTNHIPQCNLLKAEQQSQAILLTCRSRYEELERDIDGARSREAFLRYSTVSLQDTIEYQKRKLNDINSHKDSLQEELGKVVSKLETSQASEFELNAAIGATAVELDSLKKEIEKSKAVIRSLSVSKGLMGLELQNTKTKLADSITAWRETSAIVVAKTNEVACLEDSSFQSSAKCHELEKVKESLEEVVSQHQLLIETLQTNKSDLELDLNNTRSLFNAIKKSHAGLIENLDIKGTKINTLEVEIRRMRKLEDVVVSHEEKLRASSARSKELEQSEDALQTLLQDAVGKRNSLETELTGILASHSVLQAKILDTEKNSSAVEQELATHQKAKFNAEVNLPDAENQLRVKGLAEHQLQTEMRSLQDHNSKLQEQLSITHSRLEDANNTGESLKSERDGLHTALGELKKNGQQLTDQLELMSSEENRLESLKQTTVEMYSKLELQLSAAQSELVGMKTFEKDVCQRLTNSQSLVTKNQKSLQELKEVNDALSKRLQSSEEVKSSLQDEIRSINGTLEYITRTKNTFVEQLEVSGSANARLAQDLSATQHDLKEVLKLKEELGKNLATSESSHARILEQLSATNENLDQRLQSEKQFIKQIRELEASKAVTEDDLQIAKAYSHNETALHQETLQQLRNLTFSKSTVEEELAVARKKLHETEKSREATHVQFSGLSFSKEVLESDLAYLRSKLNTVENSETELSLQLEIAQEENMTMELNLKGHLQDSENGITRLEQELHVSQARLTSAEASAARVQSQLDAALVHKGNMERGLLAQLHTSNETIQRVEQDLVAAQSKLSSSDASEIALCSRFKAFEEDRANMENGFKDQVRALEDTVENLRRELRRTETNLSSTEIFSRDLGAELEISRSTSSATQRELRNEITNLTRTKFDLESDIGGIKAQLTTSQVSEKSLLIQMKELKMSSDEVEYQLRTYLETMRNTTRITEEDLISKRTRLEMTEEANKSLRTQLNESRVTNSRTERELCILQQSAHRLEDNLERLQSKLTENETTKNIITTQLQDSERAKIKVEANLTLTQQTLDFESTRGQNLEKLLQEARLESKKSTVDSEQTFATYQKDFVVKLAAAEGFQASLLQKSYSDLEKSRADQEQLRVFSAEIFELRRVSQELQLKLHEADEHVRQLNDSFEEELANRQDQLEQHLAVEADRQRLREACEDSHSKLATIEHNTSSLQTENSALQLLLRQQNEELEKLRFTPSTVKSLPRKRSTNPSWLFSLDPQVVHPRTPRRRMRHSRTAVLNDERRRSIGGVDLWQSKMKELFERPFSSGNIFTSREGEGRSDTSTRSPPKYVYPFPKILVQ